LVGVQLPENNENLNVYIVVIYFRVL
jgi:hypothetical protein